MGAKMSTSATDLEYDLEQFTGSEQLYQHWLGIKYTDGIKYLADTAGAYWLIDYIASAQVVKSVRQEPFQVWKLTVASDSSSDISADDGNGNIVFRKKIEYTDFPMKSVKLYLCDNVLLLPSEY